MMRTVTTFMSAALLAALAAGCGNKEEVKIETITEIQAREGIPVEVLTLEPGVFEAVEKEGGTVAAYNQTDLFAPIPARITAVHARVGAYVKKDDVLVEFDRSALAASYEENKKKIDQFRKTYERLASLHAEGAVAEDDYEQAKTQLEVAEMQLGKLINTVSVLAPFDGMVVAVNARENDMASPGGGQGKPALVSVAKLGQVQVDLKVNEAVIARYKKGQKAFIEHDGERFDGRISNVALSGDKMSHTFGVEALFRNPRTALKQGMYVTVNTVVYSKKKALGVPAAAIRRDGGEPYVFTAVDGKAVRAAVTLGERSGDRFEVTDGLRAGDRLVVRGIDRISDGANIKAVK